MQAELAVVPTSPAAKLALLQEIAGARVAGPWTIDVGPRIRTARVGKELVAYIHMVMRRRGPLGETLGEVEQKGTVYEWTALGQKAQVVAGMNVGSTRSAPTLMDALLEVDAFLQATNPPYELCGPLWLGKVEE